MGAKMKDISVNKSYHIKDNFFNLVNDDKLMSNKENGNFRPHFVFIQDEKIDGIYWAIPQSSKVEKYRKISDKQIRRYGKCETIEIDNFGGKPNAFLIQNMFPIIPKYIDHEHLISGKPVPIHSGLVERLKRKATRVLFLHERGVSLVFPDIDRILEMMLNELDN